MSTRISVVLEQTLVAEVDRVIKRRSSLKDWNRSDFVRHALESYLKCFRDRPGVVKKEGEHG